MNQAEFVEAVLRNSVNRAIVERMPSLGVPDCWLVSGALFQSAWNAVSRRPAEYGVKDYDLFYYDSDLSWEAEDAVIKRVARVFEDLGSAVEIRNQARVHLWYPKKFGAPYPPLSRSTDGIDRFLMRCAQVGIECDAEGLKVYAPCGFEDIEAMIIRPNRTANFHAEAYYEKAERWRRLWPELKIIAA